jgi:hypothetical protein
MQRQKSRHCFPPHEPMDVNQSARGLGGANATRMGDQAAERIAPRARTQRLEDVVFAFHDHEEIGPRMLSRIARRTGLRPEDL